MRCGCGFRGCSLRFESKRSPSCRCTANPDVCFLLSLCSVFCPSGSFTNDGVHLLTAILFICTTTTTTATVTTAAIIGALPFLPPLLQLSVLVIGRVGAGLPGKAWHLFHRGQCSTPMGVGYLFWWRRPLCERPAAAIEGRLLELPSS